MKTIEAIEAEAYENGSNAYPFGAAFSNDSNPWYRAAYLNGWRDAQMAAITAA